jgi:hypothetical protein
VRPGRAVSGLPWPRSSKLYLVTHFDTDDEARLLTEVCWPVFQTTRRS